jgi:hypothetical protein
MNAARGAIAYLVIEPGGAIKQTFAPLDTPTVQGIVGGSFETLHPRGIEATVFLAEDGKQRGFNPNWVATSLLRSRLRPEDFVVGTVVVAGLPDAEGDIQSITVKSEEAIRRLAER